MGVRGVEIETFESMGHLCAGGLCSEKPPSVRVRLAGPESITNDYYYDGGGSGGIYTQDAKGCIHYCRPEIINPDSYPSTLPRTHTQRATKGRISPLSQLHSHSIPTLRFNACSMPDASNDSLPGTYHTYIQKRDQDIPALSLSLSLSIRNPHPSAAAKKVERANKSYHIISFHTKPLHSCIFGKKITQEPRCWTHPHTHTHTHTLSPSL